jgi:hypothetical protein
MNKLIRQALEHPYCVHPVYLSQWVIIGRKPRIEHRAGKFMQFNEDDKVHMQQLFDDGETQ